MNELSEVTLVDDPDTDKKSSLIPTIDVPPLPKMNTSYTTSRYSLGEQSHMLKEDNDRAIASPISYLERGRAQIDHSELRDQLSPLRSRRYEMRALHSPERHHTILRNSLASARVDDLLKSPKALNITSP